MSTKKNLFVFIVLAVMGTGVFAQQNITNFGVVNTEQIYDRYYAKTGQIKAYEKKREDVKAEIEKRTAELRELKDKRDACKKVDDEEGVKLYNNQIKTKTESLRDYTSAKNTELQNLKKSLTDSSDFYNKLTKTIRRVAENEGLSMVLSISDEGIVWYSQSVDITEKVIRELDK